MARSKKTEKDHKVNAYVGNRVAAFRGEQGWTLAELAEQLGVSTAHLKSLESGRYSFSAALLCRLADVLERPVDAFLPKPAWRRTEETGAQWRAVYDALPARERRTLLQLGRRLAGVPSDRWWYGREQRGALISLEGIDGVVLRRQAERLQVRLRRQLGRTQPVDVSEYDFSSGLWQFMIRRFGDMNTGGFRAFERTLLFACERLYRQEREIRGALDQGALVVSTFFALAAAVYQKMEGLLDLTAVELVNEFLRDPDVVVLIDSDPVQAARRAVSDPPRQDSGTGKAVYTVDKGHFYSPYSDKNEFRRAQALYHELVNEFKAGERNGAERTVQVITLEAKGTAEQLADEVFEQVSNALNLPRK